MKCDCRYTAFYYQKIEDCKKWNVYKCGHTMIESKKKTKCDMNICEYISDICIPEKKQAVKFEIKKEEENPEELYRRELNKFIYLCEITKDFSKKYRWNYIAHINYFLNKLNFPLYFEEKESLESLKNRSCKAYVPKQNKENTFPMKLIEYPEYLAVIKPSKSEKKENKKKKKVSVITEKTKFYINSEEPEEEESKNKIEPVILESETESEPEAEDDNTFDIDNYDSGEDYEDFDDGGAFSD